MTSQELQERLTLKMMERLEGLGSTLYSATWKAQVTPAQRLLFRVRASVLRTSETGSTGWPTPTAALAEKGVRTFEGGLIEAMRNHGPDLAAAACLSGWPTCTATDATKQGNVSPRPGAMALPETVPLAGWPTPAASDGAGGKGFRQGVTMAGRMPDGSKVTMDLSASVKLAMFHNQPARLTASGQMLTGCSAAMESGGQLNPAFSRWLMGFPKAWCEAAIEAWHQMPINRRKRAPCD